MVLVLGAIDRARVSMAAELRSHGVPDTSVDNGWEYNIAVELEHANHLNDFRIAFPADSYTPIPRINTICPTFGYEDVPHVQPMYSISLDPNACFGAAPFVPVSDSRWLAFKPGLLYVVRSVPAQP